MTRDSTDEARRDFLRTVGLAAGGIALGAGVTGTATANPGKPSFGEEIYAAGTAWGTKFAAEIPPPKNNRQSFDDLYFVVDDTDTPVQLPVSEAAPGDPDYNGGRWFSMTATVDDQMAYDDLKPLTSASDVHQALQDGAITPFRDGAPEPGGGGPIRPTYFECPLLPTK